MNVDEAAAKEVDADQASIWAPRYLLTTLGMGSLILLPAFESLAVTTVMPAVSRDLGGEALYGLAFGMVFAAGLIGMVLAGSWADRRGPRHPLFAALLVFAAGLLLAGLAQSMPMLVLARAVQGIGGGALSVVIYVLVARIYPSALLPKVFAVFAAAWALPAIVGPFIAGMIAEQFHWRWVFLAVFLLLPLVLLLMLPGLKTQKTLSSGPQASSAPPAPWVKRAVWAVLAALAMLVLGAAAEFAGGLAVLIAAVGLLGVVLTVRPLLPAGTLTARRGLPSMVLLRGMFSAAFSGTEVYLVLALVDHYRFSPAAAGLSLTVSALSWGLASQVQARTSSRVPHGLAVRIGAALVCGAILAAVLATALAWPPSALIVIWFFGGAGMGFGLPRLSTLTLAEAPQGAQGAVGSALSMADSIGAAASLAIIGVVFGFVNSLRPMGPGADWLWPVFAALAVAAVFGVLAVLASGRTTVRKPYPVGMAE